MKHKPLILIAVLLMALVYGLFHLFALRFEAGDVYPEYSSLRADPLGTKAFFESLGRLVPTDRHVQSLARFQEGPESTLYFLGASFDSLNLPPQATEALESFLHRGGRLVISFYPYFYRPRQNPQFPLTNARASGKHQLPSALESWGLTIDYGKLHKNSDDDFSPLPAFVTDRSHLPNRINCYSVMHFKDQDSLWNTIYSRTNGQAVLLERSFGDGTIVVSADSFLFSNEAMLTDRQPELLAWFQGTRRQAVFEENHLGVNQSPGIMNLARKYRLHGLLGALGLLASLFLWKNAQPFSPMFSSGSSSETPMVSGKDSASGFENLLRRHVPRQKIIRLCLEQWNAHRTMGPKPTPARLQVIQSLIDAENLLPEKQRNPVQLYRNIALVLDRHRPESALAKILSPSNQQPQHP